MFSSGALAQDDGHTIRIIQEDGSVDVIDLRQKVPVSPSENPEPQNAGSSSNAVKTSKGEQKSQKAAPKPKVKKKDVAVVAPPQPVRPPPMPVQRTAPEGMELHRGQAIAIALDYAPPSSDVEVFSSEHEGRRAFSVMFKIEDGYHEVLVDAQNGTVLESRKSDVLNSQARPGYLPGGLR